VLKELDKLFTQFNDSELNYIASEIDKLPKGADALDIVEWATSHRYLPPELAFKHGPFDWSLVPHLIEPAMELSPTSPTRRVIVCKGVQIGAPTVLI
jgi:phage terminase large subunit GpA-like protein